VNEDKETVKQERIKERNTHLLVYTDTNFLQHNEVFDAKLDQVLSNIFFSEKGILYAIKNILVDARHTL